MKGFSETITIITVIAFKGVCQRITFALKNQSLSITIAQYLICSCRTSVGRNKEHFLGWSSWLLYSFSFTFVRVVFCQFQFKMLFVQFGFFTQFLMDRVYQLPTMYQPTFAG